MVVNILIDRLLLKQTSQTCPTTQNIQREEKFLRELRNAVLWRWAPTIDERVSLRSRVIRLFLNRYIEGFLKVEKINLSPVGNPQTDRLSIETELTGIFSQHSFQIDKLLWELLNTVIAGRNLLIGRQFIQNAELYGYFSIDILKLL